MRLKRIIPVILCFVIIIGCIPVHASSSGVANFLITEFWGAVKDSLVDFPGQVEGMQAAQDDPCAASPNGHHNFTKSEVPGLKGSLCEYCGADFFSFCDDAYDDYAESLPSTGVDSEGYLYWIPKFTYGEYKRSANISSKYVIDYYYFGNTSLESTLAGASAFYRDDGSCVASFTSDSGEVLAYFDLTLFFSDTAPIAGYYECSTNLDADGYYLDSGGGRHASTLPSFKYGDPFYLEAGKSLSFSATTGSKSGGFVYTTFSRFDVRPYLMRIKPLSGLVDTVNDPTYNSSSRPISIIGNFGYYNESGTLQVVENGTIFNETNNTIYNPITNTTTNVNSWTYDYSDRSYNVITEEGDTINITYGDEYITINEGDTIYNVYYVVPGGGSGGGDDGSGDGGSGDGSGDKHTHDYTSEITKQPSCLISGVRTFTCSCGDSYTKTISATGHDWVISQQVPTTYDPETGEQTQAGYTVYVCGSCAEQYKSTDGSAPPNGSSGGDDSSGGFGDIIVGLFSVIGDIIGGLLEGALVLATKALEALTGLGDLFAQMITTILGFFGGFIDFLSAMFPFLPEETTTILNFGLILMIAAAVFNKFFK